MGSVVYGKRYACCEKWEKDLKLNGWIQNTLVCFMLAIRLYQGRKSLSLHDSVGLGS